ncbi:Leucine-rich repeat receptor protein kinase MSP1, partial [Ananas comosus]
MRARATSMQVFIILLVVWLLKNQILESYGCLSVEREALLAFKSGVIDPRNCLSSWEGSDCCRWKGVRCNNETRRVEKLKLRFPCAASLDANYIGFGGEVNPSLLSLSHLKHLDLSMNNFSTGFPNFIASYKKLRYLDLSYAGFTGAIPPEFGNLSTLRYLDLSNIYAKLTTTSHGKLSWIKGLHSLRYLDLTSVLLQNANDWLQGVNMLSSLQVLRLGWCFLPSNPNPISNFNLTSLTILDLQYNLFNSTWPGWLRNFTSLTDLNLLNNNLFGPIPVELNNFTRITSLLLGSNNLDGQVANSINNLCSLDTLDLSGINIDRGIVEFLSIFSCVPLNNWRALDLKKTNIRGNLSGWLEQMTSLIYLDVSNNFFNGSIPEGIQKLSNLYFLDLSENLFRGVVHETHLMNFTKLEVLRLSGTSLDLKVDDNWVPPFQANELVLSSCRLGPRFPRWLRLQTKIFVLDLSNNDITGAIPNWFWDLTSPIVFLDLSNNQISGMLLSSLENMTSLRVLNLASNFLEGFLPFLPHSLEWLDFSSNMFSGSFPQSFFKPNMLTIHLSNNSISGNIPSSICSLQNLYILDMSNNKIFGELPNCWNSGSKQLMDINLSNNNLSGRLPNSLGLLSSLLFLHLNNNSLYGELPSALQNCPLLLLDLGQNKLSVNKSYNSSADVKYVCGNIPAELGQLENLQILDLSWNNLSGNISQSFGNFHAMASTKLPGYINQPLPTSFETAFTSMCLKAILTKIIHCNKRVKSSIFQESVLREEHRPLSLNLSYNNLSGRIPSGDQIQTLVDPTIYAGNPFLCGPPISKNCSGYEPTYTPDEKKHSGGSKNIEIYLGMGLGFLVGLWVVYGILLFKSSWRNTYFYMIDKMYYRFFVEDNWVPPFQVQELVLSSCRLGPRFPRWLRLQQEIELLHLSDNGITDTIPYWLWNISSSIAILDLSNNQISDMLPSSLENMTSLEVLNLGSNHLHGFLPSLPGFLDWPDFSNNMFFGSLPWSFFKPNLFTVRLSNNSISDGIPSSICNMQSLFELDMSSNKLFGELPNCWYGASKDLYIINLSNNKLSRQLPDSLGFVRNLEFLHLNNNTINGKLPSSLQYCLLVLLDLGQNNLSGEIPTWLGKLTNRTILRL